ncbi:hypothetical protein GCM10007094_10740 [Pseudovibrio japonicus]|uniref:Polysaccharide pyruvyl transferase domain-containing protein n=1 Tax=Pseudovibrio japonicus TaxID=366534 RepID=A0ABQ3EAK1_9HYPH|nr:polysaccharide pyruvyl transferase family protein [Pseudovibrio japonicus]GHB24545.1 hypothetical protein GCM10007094_10740 [Pseudovibrio japonicus]
MKKVFLEATYGIGNFGDDLLWSLFREQLIALGCSVTIGGDIRRAGAEAGEIDVHRTDVVGKARVIAGVDFVVIGGGGQFNDNSSRSGGAHLAITFALSRLFGRRILVCGTGFGPLSKPFARRLWRLLARKTNSVYALREAEGVIAFEELTGRDAVLCCDPIFSEFARRALKLDQLAEQRAAHPPLPSAPGLINFRNFRRNTEAELVIVGELLAEGHALEGLSADDRGDLGTDELRVLRIETLHPYRGVAPFLDTLVAAPFVVTQRFHVLCACAILGVPVVPLVYAEKMRDFCLWMGLPFVTTEDTDPKQIRSAVRAALDNGPVDQARLMERVDPLEWLRRNAWKA